MQKSNQIKGPVQKEPLWRMQNEKLNLSSKSYNYYSSILVEWIQIPAGLCQLGLFVTTPRTKAQMSVPLSCHMKLNAKQHGTCNGEDYDRIKYTCAFVCHLKQRWKHAALLSHKWQKKNLLIPWSIILLEK